MFPRKILFFFTIIGMLVIASLLTACGGGSTEPSSSSNNAETVPKDIIATAWIGENDTEVTFPPDTAGLQFTRSTDLHCDLANYSVCPDGQQTVLTAAGTVVDTTAKVNKEAWYWLQDSTHTSIPATMPDGQFTTSAYSQAVVFKKQLWVIGGSDDKVRSDIWRSADGKAWVPVTGKAAFGARAGHQVVVFKDRLWLIGGATESFGAFRNDVWSSSDGINWVQETAAAAFSPRVNFQVVLFNSKLWLIGGYENLSNAIGGEVFKNDIWSSSDGVHWVQETATAEFHGRTGHEVIAFHGKLWLIGGYYHTTPPDDLEVSYLNDIWSSSDGVHWVQVTANAAFASRSEHKVVLFNSKLWLIGGIDGTGASGSQEKNDVWSSSDAVNWKQETAAAPFSKEYSHAAVVFNDKLWTIGGYAGFGLPQRRAVWSSSDGVNWTDELSLAHLSQRSFQHVVEFNHKLFGIGSLSEDVTSDIWSSADGVRWIKEAAAAEFLPRRGFDVVAFNGKLWLVGGMDADGNLKNDVWSSIDGAHWNQETSAAAFSARREHKVVVLGDKMWLIGGVDSAGKTDVWSSVDGITWEQSPAATPFVSMFGSQVVAFNNKLWVIGVWFENSVGTFRADDVWSSSDGVTWIQDTSSAGFGVRINHQLTVFQGKLWLGCGWDENGKPLNDLWSSGDGVHWVLETPSAAFGPGGNHKMLSFENKLWVFGGLSDSGVWKDEIWASNDGKNWRRGVGVMFRFLAQ